MSTKVHWILTRAGRWHAWHDGGRSSVCRSVSAQDIEEHPAVDVRTELGPEHRAAVCLRCARKIRLPAVTTEEGKAGVWLGHLRRQCELPDMHAPLKDLIVLAKLLAQLGSPEDQEARDIFQIVRPLLLAARCAGRSEGFALLKSAEDVRKVMVATRAWNASNELGFKHQRFNLASILSVMLQLPDPAAYVRHLKEKGLEPLAVVFHPNTLARARKDAGLRGTFSGSPEYWQRTAGQLNIVEE